MKLDRIFAVVCLVFALSVACGKDDDGDSGSDDEVPTSKSGTLTTELAEDFAGDSGGLTKLENLTMTTEKSSSAVSQLQTSSAVGLVKGYGIEDEDEECEPETKGDKEDLDSDGFYGEYSETYDCSEENEDSEYESTKTTTGEITYEDEDDEDADSSGSVTFDAVEVMTEIAVAKKTYKFGYSSDGYLKKVVEKKSRTAEVSFLTAYTMNLPEEFLEEYSFPSFFYNVKTSHNTEDDELEIEGFYRAKGSKKDSETEKYEEFDYAVEITTEDPLIISETCTSNGKFAGGTIVYTAGEGEIEVSYDENCERTVKFDGEEI